MHCLLFNANRDISARSQGIYRIASVVREHGWDAEVIDWAWQWNLESLKLLAQQRITSKTQWIGVSHLYSIWSPHLEEFFLWIKFKYPNVKLISGSSSSPNFDSQVFDYYIQGYSESAIIKLLKYLFSNGRRPKFEITRVNNSLLLAANTNYPAAGPAYNNDSLLIKYEDRDFIGPNETLGIEFSRGCQFKCLFCNHPMIGIRKDYSRSTEDFREHLQDAYDRFGVWQYYIGDETFNDSTEKIKKYADVVQQLTFRPFFSGLIRADLLFSRPHDKEELLRMGVSGQFYGIESFNHQAAKSIGKGMHPDKIKQGLIDIKKYFETHDTTIYRGLISMIIGLPTETADSLEQSRQWLLNNWQKQSVVASPLRIPLSTDGAQSTLSNHYQKYGYSTIVNDPRINNLPPWDQQQLIWKNELMDIFEARKIQQQWNAMIRDKSSAFRLDPYYIGDPSMNHLDLSERLELNFWQEKQLRPNAQLFLKNYIEKKLNY
jgi:radical SAM superfamily enzyme YgiQ (UPF0313 family)